ncbi:phage tail protein [Streptomyces chrestomyceticus]|uniref:phage tail protein n=1 Tax=Streptomyces chrestomyceticus TaxID=68185 RepID=UPI0019D23916|nr:phage tail protein [Streptomyces chrestomyceticus]
MEPFATSTLFRVAIGPFALGSFTSCTGLGCTVEYEERREGGLNGHVWRLPTRVSYSNVVLTRPSTRETAAVAQWVSHQVARPLRVTGEIVALRPDRRPLTRWVLDGVAPARWQGPSFSATDSAPAIETLELVHQGFLNLPG